MATDLISPLGVDSLDLDIIKQTYKDYITANSTITDVNVEGSNISVLIDIISYINKNINSTIALNANQTTLLLSTVRQNIVYQAQGLNGYNITRPISSKMSITISATLGVGESVTIPAWSKFTCGDYTFYNQSSISLTNSIPSKVVDIIEGLYLNSTIDTNLNQVVTADTTEIKLPYNNIEHNNVSYRVKSSGDTFYSDYYVKTELLTSLENSELLFYEEIDAETSYLSIINSFSGQGNMLEVGDTYDISLLLSSGSEANNILVCTFSDSIVSNLSNSISFNIVVNSPSRAGSDVESDESIKRNAPLFNNTGLRTVTSGDYRAFLEKNSLVETSNAWGGETIQPINLGHIYLSCIPQDTTNIYLSSLEEVELLSFLRPIIGTGRIFKHPNYIIVDYEIKILGTLVSVADKETQIEQALETYFNSYFNKYRTSFFESKGIRIVENLFSTENGASVRVEVKPKIQLDAELFTQNGGLLEVYVPNSSKRNYLTKGVDRIEVPEDLNDYYSYILNGWELVTDYDEELTITFSGTVNSKPITEGAIESGTVNGDTFNFKRIYLDAVEIGKFNTDLDILNLTDITSELATTEYIDITYAPAMNIVSLKSTVIKLGSISYI